MTATSEKGDTKSPCPDPAPAGDEPDRPGWPIPNPEPPSFPPIHQQHPRLRVTGYRLFVSSLVVFITFVKVNESYLYCGDWIIGAALILL